MKTTRKLHELGQQVVMPADRVAPSILSADFAPQG